MGADNTGQPITAEVAGGVAIFAMLSSNAYHKDDRVRFAVDRLGWQRVDADGNLTNSPARADRQTGLAYDIYERRGSNDAVFAFRGTDDRKDFLMANFAVPPLNKQYTDALEDFGRYRDRHPGRSPAVTGHSLGGGLALCVSLHFGARAVTFDPSPRVFDGLRDAREPAERVIVYEDGEILQLLRQHSRKIAEIVRPQDIHRCSFDFAGDQHRSDYLALGLLKLGATANPSLRAVLEALTAGPNP